MYTQLNEFLLLNMLIFSFDVYLKKQKLDLQVAGLYVCRCNSQDVEPCSCDQSVIILEYTAVSQCRRWCNCD